MHRLQNYITEYRTNKARHDLAFTEKLYTEAKLTIRMPKVSMHLL